MSKASLLGGRNPVFVLPALFILVCQLGAAPFAKRISFTQPDGAVIQLWAEGDDFHADFETLDGYTVVFDPALRAYCYARLSPGASQLLSTSVQVRAVIPRDLVLPQHLRISADALRRQVAERYAKWDAGMQVSERWQALKASVAGAGANPESNPQRFSATTGPKLGLTLLIDFDDVPATIPQAEIIDFCNGDNYTKYGNNGSVKKYYSYVSNNKLTYSNVVTVYFRAPQPNGYYNDVTQDAGQQARMLITDVLNVMMNLTNYTTDILPLFRNLTVDSQNQVMAFNVFYAGANGGVWSMGLWPHSWSLAAPVALSPGGKKLYRYQISNIGTQLEIGTFCHENGHMLCGYPDLYDYTYKSVGAGNYCLMAYGVNGGSANNPGSNPVQVSAYLKRFSGWATTTELTSDSNTAASLSASPGAGFNSIYRYAKPGTATEYYLMECRQKTDHDAALPAAGVLVWHIDELGNNSTVNLNPNTTHANYEATLVQADNKWDLEKNRNSGDASDLYYQGNASSGYSNLLTDVSSPHSHWWDGTLSRLALHAFTQAAPDMSFYVGDPVPAIVQQPASLSIFSGETATFTVTATHLSPFRYQWRREGVNLSGATGSAYRITNARTTDSGGYTVVVGNDYGSVTSSVATLTVVSKIPMIVTQPADQSALVGMPASLNVAALGAPPLSYQWFFNGRPISGATAPTLRFPHVHTTDSGTYFVIVSNSFSSVTSSNAILAGLLLAGWGDGSLDQLKIPANAVNVVAITAGAWHNLALRADGTVMAWGDDWNGQCDVPASPAKVTAIAAGGYHSLALASDGTVVAWGANEDGQSTVPADLTGVTAIAAGTWHSLALRANGTVVAWGDNSMGQCAVPAGLSGVRAIAAGGNHSLALRTDGTVVAWGQNTDAEGSYAGQSSVPWDLNNVTAIAAGEFHSLALKADGSVTGWGDNSRGQALPPAGLGQVLAIVGGGSHSLALGADGSIFAWGNNDNGQCDLPSPVSNARAIAAGSAHSLLLVADESAAPRLFYPIYHSGQFQMSVQTLPGWTYTLEATESLLNPDWMILSSLSGNGAVQVFTDPAATAPHRFYRIHQW